ncbi:MAG: hypothetical protein AAGJ46_19215 [Planctomycetota bacterium]
MKKIALLLAVTLFVGSTTGCGLFRRVRDVFNRGAYCGPAVSASPGFVAPPAQVVVPAPAPVAVGCDPCCDPCPQPCCDPCCDPCCGPTPTSYPVADPYYGGAVMSGSIGSAPTGGFVDPGPVPPGP